MTVKVVNLEEDTSQTNQQCAAQRPSIYDPNSAEPIMMEFCSNDSVN